MSTIVFMAVSLALVYALPSTLLCSILTRVLHQPHHRLRPIPLLPTSVLLPTPRQRARRDRFHPRREGTAAHRSLQGDQGAEGLRELGAAEQRQSQLVLDRAVAPAVDGDDDGPGKLGLAVLGFLDVLYMIVMSA